MLPADVLMNRLPPVFLLALSFVLSVSLAVAETFTPYEEGSVPRTTEELWADIDPAAEPLDVAVVKEWEEEGISYRYLLYTVCTFRETPCRVSALYIYPTGAEKAPAFVWSHGGGQRAEQKRGEYFARHGYASIDINWGGREVIEGVEENTDWGKLDPSQGPQFYPGALRKSVKLNLEPDEFTIDPVPSPRNGNWFLLSLAGRRAITFLEQQPEVNPERIGFTGYSMGGNITSYCAIDPRLRAVAPMVGGTGFKMEDFPGLEGSSNRVQYRHHELFSSTIDSEAYWPLVKCPVFFLSATNDFHGIFDRSYRCVDLLPHDDWHASYNLHYNHSLRSEQYGALKLWFDHHLKGEGPDLPNTASVELAIGEGADARFQATTDPNRVGELVSTEVLYSHDPNPRTRHWKTAESSSEGGVVSAKLPVRANLPLLAFVNCTYRIEEPFGAFEDASAPADVYTITSDLATHYPDTIRVETLREGALPLPVFHNFAKDGLEGWGTSSHRRGIRTYRFQDPERIVPEPGKALVARMVPTGKKMVIRIRVEKNQWLFPKDGAKASYSVSKPVGPDADSVRFERADFVDSEEASMENWDRITQFDFEVIDLEKRQPLNLTNAEERAFLQALVWE